MKIRIFAVVFLLCVGMLALPQAERADFYEDFEGAQIDLTNWTVVEYGSLNASLVGGKLFINGTYDPGETSPNTGGWNQYWLIYNQSFSGFVDISVSNAIVNMAAGEVAVGLGVIVDPGLVYDNVTSWGQYYFNGLSAIGRFGKWDNLTSTTLMLDNTDITIGEVRHHRMIVYDNKSVQLLIDGVTKGWSNISGYSAYYPLVTVGMKFAGTYLEAEFDDFLVLTDAIPDAVLTATSTNLDVGELVGFDGSQSSYVVGSIEAYSFDFGDGDDTGWIDDSFTTHSYAAEGSYDARLKVRADNGKESDWASVTICVDCAIPVAELTGSPTQVKTFEPVNFSAEGSWDADGTVVGYFFDFDDGSTSGWIMSPYADHHFIERGAYHVRVKVLDDDGHESLWSTSLVEIVVENQPPVAVLTASALEVYVGEMVCFNGSMSHDIDGVIVFYEFYLGDGYLTGGRHDAVYCYEYDEAGTYNVTLVVEDNHLMESENEAKVTIVVKEKEEPLDVLGWWIVVLVLLLIILVIVTYIAIQQRRLVKTREPPEEPPPTEDESEQSSMQREDALSQTLE